MHEVWLGDMKCIHVSVSQNNISAIVQVIIFDDVLVKLGFFLFFLLDHHFSAGAFLQLHRLIRLLHLPRWGPEVEPGHADRPWNHIGLRRT